MAISGSNRPVNVTTTCDRKSRAISVWLRSGSRGLALCSLGVLSFCAILVSLVKLSFGNEAPEELVGRLTINLSIWVFLVAVMLFVGSYLTRFQAFKRASEFMGEVILSIHRLNGTWFGWAVSLLVSWSLLRVLAAVVQLSGATTDLIVFAFCLFLLNLVSIILNFLAFLYRKTWNVRGFAGKVLGRTLLFKVWVSYDLGGSTESLEMVWIKALFIYLGLCEIVVEDTEVDG
jgi:hypothetical protein